MPSEGLTCPSKARGLVQAVENARSTVADGPEARENDREQTPLIIGDPFE